MANFSRCSSRHKADIKAKIEKQIEKQSEKSKEKGLCGDGNKIGVDTLNPILDMQIDSEKRKSAQESENFDLVVETDDWAASSAT